MREEDVLDNFDFAVTVIDSATLLGWTTLGRWRLLTILAIFRTLLGGVDLGDEGVDLGDGFIVELIPPLVTNGGASAAHETESLTCVGYALNIEHLSLIMPVIRAGSFVQENAAKLEEILTLLHIVLLMLLTSLLRADESVHVDGHRKHDCLLRLLPFHGRDIVHEAKQREVQYRRQFS